MYAEVDMCCATSSTGIIGSISPSEAIHLDRYVNTHTDDISARAIQCFTKFHHFFGDRMGLWLDLLDINPCSFYLNGSLKDKATGSNGLHSEYSLKESIQNRF